MLKRNIVVVRDDILLQMSVIAWPGRPIPGSRAQDGVKLDSVPFVGMIRPVREDSKMFRILLVSHCPSENTARLRDAALEAIHSLHLETIEVVSKNPPDANADAVLSCDGIVIGTTENFAYMAGLIKDFFERIYYPCLESKQGLPAGLYIRAGEDGRGTQAGIEKIMTGLRWKLIGEPLILRGPYRDEFEEEVAELAMTMAAGLDAEIF
jgi:multimeric flavodoxin WrbA